MREDYLENIYLIKNEHCKGCRTMLLIEEDYYCNVCEHFYDKHCKRCGSMLLKGEIWICSECEIEEEDYSFDFYFPETGVTRDVKFDMLRVIEEQTFMIDEETLMDDEEIKEYDYF